MSIPSTHISLLCDMMAPERRDEAWGLFQVRYHDLLHGWCRRRGLSTDNAEDLTQEILLKLFRELPRYAYDPAQGRFRSWLKAMVNNALTDSWRQQQRRPERVGVGGTAFLDQLVAIESPEALAELSELLEPEARATVAEVRSAAQVKMQAVERVKAKLKDSTWQAFYLTQVEQRSAAEVAQELNLTIATVYKACYRVKQMLGEEYRNVASPP